MENNLNEAKKKEKSKSMANKLQLMRIKNKATGSNTIPTSDRVYFNIIFRQNDKIWPVFVSKTWSVGRIIDAIAVECKLRNNNNKSTEKKLRLFKQDNKQLITKNLSTCMVELLNCGHIIDGETLIIEYVDEFCDCIQ